MKRLLSVLAIVFGTAVVLRMPVLAAAPPHANGEITMSGPSQKIKFDTGREYQTVEYWNYTYPEGAGTLHYTAHISCSNVNTNTKEARFMFQIPAGHPGLSGLYVEAYVKINNTNTKNYTYGHTATSDLATATAWCDPGNTAVPPTYHVDKGVLYVKPTTTQE
jgi:hypothetical protein